MIVFALLLGTMGAAFCSHGHGTVGIILILCAISMPFSGRR